MTKTEPPIYYTLDDLKSAAGALIASFEYAMSKGLLAKACSPNVEILQEVLTAMGDASTRKDEAACASSPTIGGSPSEISVVADKALLMAARWFKLYQEDESRYEHPASTADLIGMFNAMQQAREEIKAAEQKPVSVDLEKCAFEGRKACSNFLTIWDGKDPFIFYKHIAKVVLDAAGVKYE